MLTHEERNSEFYNTLSEMGLLSTEDCRIQSTRDTIGQNTIKICPISYKDVERIGYFNPHFFTDIEDKGKFEIWIGDEYINPNEITWIEGHVHLYGILPKQYDEETTVVKLVFVNDIVKRYSFVAESEGDYTHVERVSLRVSPYKDMEHPERCAYYIADGKICSPEVIRISEDLLEFRCNYKKNIDLVFSGSLVGTFNLTALVGTYIDNPYSNRCYHHFVVDNDPQYPIDTKFYPCVMVDKDCVVRVFSDNCTAVPMPEISRLMVYPEFIDIQDPYNTDNEYLNHLPRVTEVIKSADSDDTILYKFSKIAAYCYRAWEKFPFFCNEQSDFLMCDNSVFGKPTFVASKVYRIGAKTTDSIISNVPYEGYRDILFYDGMVLSNYEVVNLTKVASGSIVENPNGTPTYVISNNYDPDRLTLIKFNAGEDTMIVNIGDYVDASNLAHLHIKMNRFYRNMLVLRGKVYDFDADDQYVRVSSTPPSEHDEHLWFELLVNVVPEIFNESTFEVIKSFGLDPYNLPEDLKEGMYTLGLEPDAGPEQYTELLFTYFKLSKHHRKYLVIQSGDGVDDPRVQKYYDLMYGKLPESPEINDTVLENPKMDNTESFNDYDITKGPPPMEGVEPGDIAVDGDSGMYDDMIEDLLDGVGSFDADEYELDDISYMNMETGKSISGDAIASLTVEDKRNIITRYIKDGNEEDRAAVLTLWNGYLDNMNEDTLNLAVYKVLLTDYAYNLALNLRDAEKNPTPMKDVKYIISEETPVNQDIGTYWLDIPDDASAPVITEAVKHNLAYIYSAYEPDDAEIGDLWINIHAVTLQSYIEDIISNPLTEAVYYLPEGFFDGERASVVFDYGAHGTDQEVELFQDRKDNSLHKINWGKAFAGEPQENDVWFEFLDEIDDRVCYSDTEAMVLNVNERLIYVQFDHDNITSFLFDDIVMNFKGKLGIRYMSIVADLLNSGVIKQEDVNIFYKRLVTGFDKFDLGLERLYTGRSHVISTAKIDTSDYAVTYSTNIGRMHVDYTGKDVTNRERESAYRMVVDYSNRDIAFIGDRMMLFVNGRYIPRSEYEEIAAGKIQLLNFHEIIACVDIFYSVKDSWLSRAKKACIKFWNAPDTSVSIQRPDINYDKMELIHIKKYTHRGYYDVLLEEYIFNGRLMRMLRYLEEHPDEKDAWVLDLKRKFHAISDTDVVGVPEKNAKIIIPGLVDDGFPPYVING